MYTTTTIVVMLLLIIARLSISEKIYVLVDSATFVETLAWRRCKRPFLQQQLHHRLYLETSPLIGGPSWLLLHVKVVLESKGFYKHQWDLIPVNATNTTTLQNLVTLKNVPAQIRYRIYSISDKVDGTQSSAQEFILSATYDSTTIPMMTENIPVVFGSNSQSVEREFSLNKNDFYFDHTSSKDLGYVLLRAHRFCLAYMNRTDMQLQLVVKNCWTFALQLLFDLQSDHENSDEDLN